MSFGILGALGGRRRHDRRVRETGRIARVLGYDAKASDLRHHEPEIVDGFLDLLWAVSNLVPCC